MRVAVLLVTAVLLSSCIAEKRKLGEGAVTNAPLGHVTLCAREPEHKLCKKQ